MAEGQEDEGAADEQHEEALVEAELPDEAGDDEEGGGAPFDEAHALQQAQFALDGFLATGGGCVHW
jgi:hypothetical protein